MKYNRIITLAAASALFVSSGITLSGCTGDFNDLNTNQYEVDPSNLPFAAQFIEPMTYVYAPHQNMFQFWTNLSIDLFGGYFMTPHNFSGNGNADYKLNRGFCGGMYENYYLHIFNNTRRLIKACDEKGISDFAAVMRVVQAYATANATDAYGPIAYKSVIASNGVSFAYDKQEDVYTEIFKLLDDAIQGFQHGTSTADQMKAFDYWCNGDKQLWIKVANQFKLRYAMRIVKANPALAKQKAEEAVAGGVLTASDRDILIDHGLSNELTRMFAWGDCGMNASLVTIMEGFNDPRIALYMKKNADDVKVNNAVVVAKNTKYLGIRGGSNLPNKPNAWTNYSSIVCDYATPLPVMKVAEAYFLRAEGAVRGWNMMGNAKDFYEKGIEEGSCEDRENYYQDENGDNPYKKGIAAYTQQANAIPYTYNDPTGETDPVESVTKIGVKWNDGDTPEMKLEKIITQKYIAAYPESYETWVDLRRTGYPKLFEILNAEDSDGSIDDGETIRRLPFPGKDDPVTFEDLRRTAFKTLTGGDYVATRLWWDTKGPNFQ